MPVLWRYLLGQYLKVAGFCCLAFIALLLTLRLEEIARFAALGTSGGILWRFIAHQIPYILPIALPISCLISSLLLTQRLSDSFELTALRSGGYSLGQIAAPLLLAAALLSVVNFYIVSEIATNSHLVKRLMRQTMRTLSPLAILQNERLAQSQGVFASTLGPAPSSQLAQDVVVAFLNPTDDQLNLILAKELRAEGTTLEGNQVTCLLVRPLDRDEPGTQLIVDNSASMVTHQPDLAALLGKDSWKLQPDYMQSKILLMHIQELEGAITSASAEERSSLQQSLYASTHELVRRGSIALAVFTFTLLGFAFGLQTQRQALQTRVIWTFLLAAFFLGTYFSARRLDTHAWLPVLLYASGHVVLLIAAGVALKQVNEGRA